MNRALKSMLERVLDHGGADADLAKLPASYRRAGRGGGGFMGRIATMGLLRLAFRWPALSVILVLSMLAARVASGRSHRAEVTPAPRPVK